VKISELPCNIDGKILHDGEFDICGMLSTCEQHKRILSYINNERYIRELANEDISCIICTEKLVEVLPKHIKGIIVSENPGVTFWHIHSEQRIIKFPTLIGVNCQISEKAYISPENVIIGNNVIIEEFVSIKAGTQIGDNCVIRAGSIVGGEGFQLQRQSDGTYIVVKHFGKVIIGNNVELQQSVCVDKAIFAWDSTIVGDGTKVDNLVHVGHAAKIGKNCEITAGVIIGGSDIIEDNVWLGLNATIRNTIMVEQNAFVSMGSVVTKKVGRDKQVSGNFAIDHNRFLQNLKQQTFQGQ